MKQRFNISIKAVAEVDNEEQLNERMEAVAQVFPELKITQKNLTVYADAAGTPLLFEKDPQPEAVEDPQAEPEA